MGKEKKKTLPKNLIFPPQSQSFYQLFVSRVLKAGNSLFVLDNPIMNFQKWKREVMSSPAMKKNQQYLKTVGLLSGLWPVKAGPVM